MCRLFGLEERVAREPPYGGSGVRPFDRLRVNGRWKKGVRLIPAYAGMGNMGVPSPQSSARTGEEGRGDWIPASAGMTDIQRVSMERKVY